jgi:NADP-dependent 3-hydroxy acid dehydrogenase YdfG
MAKQARILAGQTAAITGAARGIGRATARALTRVGVRVAIGDLDLEMARKTASELGPTAVALSLDVTERESFARFLDDAETQLGPVDVLINNAGIMQVGRFMDEDDLTARRMVDINIHGVILGMKLGLERMVARGHGHIVNISSQAGKFGAPGGATYSATKHAVVGLTEAVRGELRMMGLADDVLLSYVMPFVVNTELGGGLGQARGMKNLQPADVADAILDALQHGTVDVWVPRSAKPTQMLGTLLPRRLAEGMARAMKADQVLASADPQARHAYELRASASEPGLEPASEPARIGETTGS